jgi:hypothetical protein
MSGHLRPLFLCLGLLLLLAGTIVLSANEISAASGSVAASRPIPVWGTDVDINTVPADNHEAFSLAFDPTSPNKVVAGFKYEDSQGVGSGYSFSSDAGRTWTGGSFTGLWGTDVLTPSGNTSVGYNGAGTAFLASRAESNSASGYFVLTSTDGISWSTPVAVVTSTYSVVRDQARLAVDQRSSGPYAGDAYLAWHYSPGNDVGIFVSHSSDGGHSWSRGTLVSDPSNNYSFHPALALASDGSVYIVSMWLENGCFCNPPHFLLDRSTDGGVTWGTDQLVTGAAATQVGALDSEGHDLVIRGSDTPEAGVEVNNFPVVAVAPDNPNTVYVVWNDGRWDTDFTVYGHTGKHGDIAFSRSTNGGATWSAPLRVNDDPVGNGIDQFMPAIAVASDGTIGVSWYDRRVNPGSYLYDTFYRQSTDGGLTWSPNQRVSDASSDPMVGPNAEGVGDLGEYRSMALAPDYAISAWLDSRNGQTQEFYVDTGFSPASTPTPTLAPSAIPTNTAQASPTTVPSATNTAQASATTVPSATPTVCTISFTDVPAGSTFYPYIHCLACLGIINGYPDGTFKPNNNVTRGQLSKIVSNAAGFSDNQTARTFQDVPVGSTFFQYIGRLASRGYISGYPCGGPGEACVPPANRPYFRPNNNSTRGQISKIVSNAAGFSDTPTGQQFEDVPAGSTYYTYTYRQVSRSVMSGYACGGAGEPCILPANLPYFRPNNNATRGQTSKIVSNIFFPDCNPQAR